MENVTSKMVLLIVLLLSAISYSIDNVYGETKYLAEGTIASIFSGSEEHNDFVIVAVSNDVYSELLVAAKTDDNVKTNQLSTSEQIFKVNNYTKVEVLSQKGSTPPIAEIKILDGEYTDRVVWIEFDFLRDIKTVSKSNDNQEKIQGVRQQDESLTDNKPAKSEQLKETAPLPYEESTTADKQPQVVQQPKEQPQQPIKPSKDLKGKIIPKPPSKFNLFSGVSVYSTDRGVAIFSIKYGCHLSKAGLERGDIILTLNEQEIKTISDWHEVTGKIRNANPKKVKTSFTRANKVYKKTIKR